MKKIFQLVSKWFRQTTGGIAVYMALMIPVLTGAIGMAIDVSQSYLMQERLSRALDAAALAVAGSSNLETESDMKARIDKFMEANYPAGKIGSPYDIQLVINGNSITVSAAAKYDTTFLRFLGFDTIDTYAKTTVQRQVQGIEVALVLDNTGSMSYKPSGSSITNIEALKNSSRDFVNIMFSKANKPTDVRIGLVPYANSVRIGLYGLGLVPDPFTGNSTGVSYNDGDSFITLPSGETIASFYAGNSGTTSGGSFNSNNSSINNSSKGKWYGCVIEHKTGGWNIKSSTNDPHPNDVSDDYEGPWETYRYGYLQSSTSSCSLFYCSDNNYKSNGTCTNSNKKVCYFVDSVSNKSCPYANMIPLSSDQTNLLNGIKTMQAGGNTQGNTGMIWGLRVISPEAPFTEGSVWGSENWKKAIIMMTDGDNTWDNNYSEYWLTGRNTGISANTLDSRFTEVCELLRDKDVLVYTVVFKSQTDTSQATKNLYKNCATKEDMYFYAPTQSDLQVVFQQIAHELSNLHITE